MRRAECAHLPEFGVSEIEFGMLRECLTVDETRYVMTLIPKLAPYADREDFEFGFFVKAGVYKDEPDRLPGALAPSVQ